MQTRIYLPLTVAALQELARDGSLGPAPLEAYAVTSDLRRLHPSADEEELEYLAFLDAAASRGFKGRVPVVAAADVDSEEVGEVLAADTALSSVRLGQPVPRRRIASFHVADPSQGADGSEPEMSWYDATELDVVLDLLS